MSLDKVSQFLPTLNKNSQKRFFSNVLMLFTQFTRALSLRGPYRLVLDSNIIMRLESYRNGNVTEGVLAVFVFFEFLKISEFKCDIVILPSVFYEFVRQKNFQSVKQHWDDFKHLRDTINNELGRTPFFEGTETFHHAKILLERIEYDVNLISEALLNYKRKDWSFNFFRDRGEFAGMRVNPFLIEVPPIIAAEAFYKELGLQYFDEEQVKIFLIEHICKHLCEHPKNDRAIIDKYNKVSDFLLTKILNTTTKGNLTGIADIDMLTLCNVQSQFNYQAHGHYYPASIGLSIDSNLSDALMRFSGLRVICEEVISGIDNDDSINAKTEAFMHDQGRITEGDLRKNDMYALQKYFFENVFSTIAKGYDLSD